MPATTMRAWALERVEKTTRAPEQWEAIKKALGNDRRRIEEAFCRPLLVERTLRSRFAFDQKVHAEPHQKARQARAAFLAKEKIPGTAVRLLRRRAEAAPATDQMLEKAKADATGPRVLRPPPVDAGEGAPFPIDPEMAAVLEKELRRPGDVTTILEQRDWFEVFRLIAVTDDARKVEAVRFPKVDFESWFKALVAEELSPSRRLP